VKTFQAIALDNWGWAFIYLAIGTVLTTLITIINNFIQAPSREQQSIEFTQRLGPSVFTSLLKNIQNPFFTLAIGIFGFCFIILIWILLPYGLGRAFGGSKSFGNFAYNSALFITPISVLDSLLALALSGLLGGLFLILSLSLDAFRFYLVYVNLQAAMGLSKGKAVLVVLIPVILASLLFCSLIIFLVAATFSK
jgi:hypothetical protein